MLLTGYWLLGGGKKIEKKSNKAKDLRKEGNSIGFAYVHLLNSYLIVGLLITIPKV